MSSKGPATPILSPRWERKASKSCRASGLSRETELSSLYKNSMRLIKLTARIENELDVEVPLFDVMNMRTLGDLIDRVAADA